MTKGEDQISERLDALEERICSKDLNDLRPRTTREYLMIMYPTQKSILEHMEEINEFGKIISARVGFLEAAWKVGGALIIVTLVGIAAKLIFG